MKKETVSQLKQLGQELKKERKRQGLTQTELGQLTGTSINFISQIEVGKASAQIGKVLRVMQVLGFELHTVRGSGGLVLDGDEK